MAKNTYTNDSTKTKRAIAVHYIHAYPSLTYPT